MHRLVLVDIDGTLLEGRSSEALFAAHLWSMGLLGPTQALRAAAFAARWASHYGRHVMKKNKAYLAGLDVARIGEQAETFVRQTLQPRLRPEMLRRVDWHRRAGDRVVLLSGTPGFIAAPLARLIGAEHWHATVLVECEGRFADVPPLIHPFGDEKLRLAVEICERTGESLDRSVAYADSWHDVALLRRVDRAVVVAPDRRLRRLARRLGWEILQLSAAKDARTPLALVPDQE